MQIELRISDHMESRIQQRGLKASCWDIILKYGTYISEDRIMLTKKASKLAIFDKLFVNMIYWWLWLVIIDVSSLMAHLELVLSTVVA